MGMISAAREILEFEREVSRACRRTYDKSGVGPVDNKTPLDALLATDSDENLEEWGIRSETVRRMFEYICQDGLEPWNVLGNVYAIAKHMALPPWAALTVRDQAILLGDSHGRQHWLMQKRCVNPLRRAGAKSWKAPGQKSLASRGRFSRAQEGNSNRRRKIKSRHRRHKQRKAKTDKL